MGLMVKNNMNTGLTAVRSRVSCPVLLVHGEQDWIVPIAQARHTASLLVSGELREYPQHGHLSVGVEALSALVDVRVRSESGG